MELLVKLKISFSKVESRQINMVKDANLWIKQLVGTVRIKNRTGLKQDSFNCTVELFAYDKGQKRKENKSCFLTVRGRMLKWESG